MARSQTPSRATPGQLASRITDVKFIRFDCCALFNTGGIIGNRTPLKEHVKERRRIRCAGWPSHNASKPCSRQSGATSGSGACRPRARSSRASCRCVNSRPSTSSSTPCRRRAGCGCIRGWSGAYSCCGEGAPLLDPEQLPELTAAAPIVAEQRPPPRLDTFDSIVEQFEAKPDYFLRVTADPLDKVGFHTGDVVAVRRASEANDGDVVVARLGSEITLKRYCRTAETTVERQPESTNPAHEPIRIDPQRADFEIVGVVVGAIVGARRRDDCAPREPLPGRLKALREPGTVNVVRPTGAIAPGTDMNRARSKRTA